VKKTGAVLDPILKNLGLESGVRLVRIRHDWYRTFDEQISSQLFPASFSGSELLLHVSSPVWMQQFSYHRNHIIEKLKPYGVQSIRFRLGKIPAKKKDPLPPKAAELTPENQLFVRELLVELKDENLKEAVKNAVEKSFRPAITLKNPR
jgi:hypothetical protein